MAFANMESNNLEPSLAKEGSSVHALTFDEFQLALGDPDADLASMNMDEFLRSIWTAEESQAMAAAMNHLDGSNGWLSTQISPQKQGSLCLPRTLSMKMVEEVWKSLQPQQETLELVGAGGGQQLRPLTLGEVTLEDFLVKAGIVRESPPYNPSPHCFQGNGGLPGQGNDEKRPMGLNTLSLLMSPSSSDAMQQDDMLSPVRTPAQQGDRRVNTYDKGFSQQQQHEIKPIPQGSAMVEAAPSYIKTPLSPSYEESSADTSNQLTAQFGILAQPGRKGRSEGPIEQVIQRRRRRMIKNRESAARSRARKQAYTLELEAEVYRLKEENMKLMRKQEEEYELRKKQLWSIFEHIFQVRYSKLLKKLEDCEHGAGDCPHNLHVGTARERCRIPSWVWCVSGKGDTDLDRW